MQHINLIPVDGITTATPSITNMASKRRPVIVTSFEISGNNWRRIYSDGWVEMGGYVAPVSTTGYNSISVTFPTGWEFTTTPLQITCQPITGATTGGDANLYGVYNVSSTGFTYYRGAANTYTVGFYWIAKGI